MALGVAEDDSIRVTLYGDSTTSATLPCALRFSRSGELEHTSYRFGEAVLGLPEGGTAFGHDRGGRIGVTLTNAAGEATGGASTEVPLDNSLRAGARLLREPSGSFLLAASRLARFGPDGLLLEQTALPGDAFSAGAELDGTGRVLAHAANAGVRVHAFRTDLALDTSFGDGGSVEVDGTDFVGPRAPFIRDVPSLAHTSIALTRDGRIYLTSLAPTPRVFRLLPSGALDPSFGTGGRIDLQDAGTPPGGAPSRPSSIGRTASSCSGEQPLAT